MQRLIARISGKVQRAGYRGKVVTIAKAFGLRGYVQNLSDGRVKVVAEGDEADLERFANALMMKNSIIYVTNVEKQLMPATGEYDGFAKIVDEGETDSRLDAAMGHLKDLIELTRQSVSHQEKMLGKQDQMLEKMDQMLGKQDQMLGKLDYAEKNIVLKLDDVQESIVGEIKELRSDIKPLVDDRLLRIESDVSQIKAKMGL
ncbi:MAG TPA: acylphosphatase [Methanotrichaceae archaeon]|nr:acylphosphatase [Methanotrichaceae archaeon]